MIYDHIINKYSEGLPLLELINVEAILKKLPTLYVPSLETYESGDIFMKNGDTVFIKETGPVKIRFLLFDNAGRIMTQPESAYTQLIKQRAKYLARLSCPAMNFSAPNLTVDYFVDISSIKLQPVSSMYAEERTEKNNSKVTAIIEDYGYRFLSIDTSSVESELITKFDLNRENILEDYFK